MTEKMFRVGRIINTHGIRGEVRVKRLTDFEERFNVGSILYLVIKDEEPIQLKITSHRMHKQYDLLKFEGYTHIDDVEPFKGAYLKIKEEQQTELDDGEFYVHEITGCIMYTVDHERLGTIIEVLKTGANDVWVVEQDDGKEILIPYIDDVVKKINIKEKKVFIHLMEGLLD